LTKVAEQRPPAVIENSPAKGDITGEQALALARKECTGVIDVPETCRITVTYENGRYTVTFWKHPPPNRPGSSYHARIIVGSANGEILQRYAADA
jgi:hypothetical protein